MEPVNSIQRTLPSAHTHQKAPQCAPAPECLGWGWTPGSLHAPAAQPTCLFTQMQGDKSHRVLVSRAGESQMTRGCLPPLPCLSFPIRELSRASGPTTSLLV